MFHCAFENPDGSLVAVITNQGAVRNCELGLGGKVAQLPLAENSVTTIVTGVPVWS
jgi:hypothetical protein